MKIGILQRLAACVAAGAVAVACGSGSDSGGAAPSGALPGHPTAASAGLSGPAAGGPRGRVSHDDVGTPFPKCSADATVYTPNNFDFTLGSDKVGVYVASGLATSSDSASNHGTSAISNVTVDLVFWGTQWAEASTLPSSTQLTQAMQTLFTTSYFDALKQYGVQSVTFGKAATIASVQGMANPGPYTVDDLPSALAPLIANETFELTPSTIFVFMMPPGSSTPTDCGYHAIEDATFTGLPTVPSTLEFPVNVAWVRWGDLDSMTEVATHEISEAATDPDGNGWLIDRDIAGSDEIGDACNFLSDYLSGVKVQSIWSNTDKGCIIPFAVPTITSMSPPDGPAGTTVTLTGTNIGDGDQTTLDFNGTELPVSCPSTTQCTFVAPPYPNLPDGQPYSGIVSVSLTSDYSTVCLPGLPNSGETCQTYTYPCVPLTTAQACGSVTCGPTPDGCGGTIDCPVNCPSGETCAEQTNYTCCTPPQPGQSEPNQCPPICPLCPSGEICQVTPGYWYGVCVVNHRCQYPQTYCASSNRCVPPDGYCAP